MTDVVNESFNSDPYLDVETLNEFETILSSPEEGVEQAPAESPNKPQENESSKEEIKPTAENDLPTNDKEISNNVL